MIRKLILWLLFLPVLAICVVLAVSNRNPVDVKIDLIDLSYPVPLYAVFFAGLFLGFVWAAIMVWIGAGKTRAKARQERVRANRAEFREKRLQHDLETTKKSVAAVPSDAAQIAGPGKAAEGRGLKVSPFHVPH